MRSNRMALAIAVALSVVLMASTAMAEGAAVTRGDFGSYADGPALGYQVEGHATMVRTADGKTLVSVQVRGLTPNATYGSHVHNQACSDGSAGGHYRFDAPVPGGGLDGQEIWPGPFTANSAGNGHGKATVAATAGPTAQSVVIHAPSGQKIACADLS